MEKASDSKLTFIKLTRALVYLVYAYLMIAVVTLVFGFTLLLLGANPDTPFVNFVYNLSAEFLQPFRGMFPVKQISDRSYFSAAGLFAIIFYSIFATAIHALIDYITIKQLTHQDELEKLQRSQVSRASTTTRKT